MAISPMELLDTYSAFTHNNNDEVSSTATTPAPVVWNQFPLYLNQTVGSKKNNNTMWKQNRDPVEKTERIVDLDQILLSSSLSPVFYPLVFLLGASKLIATASQVELCMDDTDEHMVIKIYRANTNMSTINKHILIQTLVLCPVVYKQ